MMLDMDEDGVLLIQERLIDTEKQRQSERERVTNINELRESKMVKESERNTNLNAQELFMMLDMDEDGVLLFSEVRKGWTHG